MSGGKERVSREEVIKLMRRLVVPCQYFQIHPATASLIAIGYCWKRQLEIVFQRGLCKECPSFVCGLFEPKWMAIPEDPSGLVLVYKRAMVETQAGIVPNLFTWAAWQDYKQKLKNWATSLGGKVGKRWSKVSSFLTLGVDELPLAEYNLPKAGKNESIYDYFARVHPKGYSKDAAARVTVAGFREAVQAYITSEGMDLQLDSVIARAIRLRSDGKTPDD